jgi:hypothetical protein
MGLRPVKPTLNLSSEAINSTLPDGWLKETREFLTRTGSWAEHPTKSAENFASIPALGVTTVPGMVGPEVPKFISIGFGDIGGLVSGLASCPNNSCGEQDLIGTGEGADRCEKNLCEKQSCEDYTCDKNWCSDQDSCTSKFHCDKHTSILDSISELESYWNDPFVQELRQYFGIDSTEDLALAVSHYVGRNMYDASALSQPAEEGNKS